MGRVEFESSNIKNFDVRVDFEPCNFSYFINESSSRQVKLDGVASIWRVLATRPSSIKGYVYDGTKIIVKIKFPHLLYSVFSNDKEEEVLQRKHKDKARKDLFYSKSLENEYYSFVLT